MKRTKVAAIVFLLLSAIVPGLALAAAPSDPFSRSPSSPEAEGMDSELLLAMMAVIDEQNARPGSADTIDSVIVIRHGNVVLEAYPNPSYGATGHHHLFSVTKSITSLLVGIALDLGLIGSLADPILSYFPDVVPQGEVQSKSAITIEHLLTMSAGLEWDEDTLPTSDPRNDFTRLEMSADTIGFVLGKPVVGEPGTLFWYNTGLSEVLSALVAGVSGQTLLAFANEHLFGPLGIDGVRWNRDRAGIQKGGTQLYMTPRDLAKIGVLCLSDGVWNGEEVVSSEWLAQSTRTRIRGRPDYFSGRGYAYHWWTLDEYGVYYASGSQGQYLYVFPQMDLVVVFTATVQRGEIFPERLAREFILPSIAAAE
ncbi:MAG: serine hydrolase [Candidatus Bipolaricaulis sp.]|nr:serine hydrolase [Candidatus Bipolaricaulis sp.]